MIVGIWKPIKKAVTKLGEYTELYDSNNVRLTDSNGVLLNAIIRNRLPKMEKEYVKTDNGWQSITKEYALVGRSLFFHCGDLYGGEI